MERNRAVVTAALVVALILVGWWVVKRSNPAATVQLIDRFAQAKKEPNEAALYSVLDATLDGETRRAIAIAPTIGTRLTFRIEVPDDGWLNVWLGLKPEAWTQEGDGVLFHVGISDGRAYEQLFSQHLHPFANDGDRKWIQAMVDLSAYSGDEVDLIFNTRSGKPEKGDVRADYALWGEPTVIQR